MNWSERRTASVLMVAVPAAITVITFAWTSSPVSAWQSTGGALELAGFLTVAWGLENKLARFSDRPGIRGHILNAWNQLVGWFSSLFGGEPEGRTVNLSGSAHGTASVRANVTVKEEGDASLEQRVEALEEELKSVRRKIAEVRTESREAREKLNDRLSEVEEDMAELEDRLRSLVQRLALGSLRWEAVGVVWFMTGVVANTWPHALPTF